MKNILFMLLGFTVFYFFVVSCKGKNTSLQNTLKVEESVSIDFSEIRTIRSSVACFEKAKGYIFDSTKAVVYDDIDSAGHYMEQVDVLFYVDQNKDVRIEYQIPTAFGSISKSYIVEFLVILSGTLNSNDNKITIGGDNQVLGIKPTVCLIFGDPKKAIGVATTLNNWFKELLKKPLVPEVKGTDI